MKEALGRASAAQNKELGSRADRRSARDTNLNAPSSTTGLLRRSIHVLSSGDCVDDLFDYLDKLDDAFNDIYRLLYLRLNSADQRQ